jgi:hypothetical protein
MARLQYQPATKPRGFQPIQLSRAGIARMEEEGNRVIRNLEKERDATIRQRQENLQAMERNAAYELASQEKNQKILQTNLKTEQSNIEAEQKAKQQQADAKAKSIESTVSSLINFSTTLGKQASERTKQMIIDQTAEGAQSARQEYLNNPKQQNNFATVESQLDVNIEKFDQTNFIAGQAGLDSSLGTARSLAANPGRGYYWKKGYYNEFIKQQTPMLVDRVLQSTEELFVDENGKKFSGLEAVSDPDKMRIVLGRVQNGLYGATGLDINSLEPGFLEDSSKYVAKYSAVRMQQASDKATNIIYDNLAQEGRSHIEQGRIGMGYRLLLKNPKVGREGALKEVFALYYAQNADGSFRYSVDELDNTKLLGDKTIREERGNSQRYQNAIAARRKAKTDFLRNDQARVRTEAKEFDRQAYDGLETLLNAEGATPDRAEQIIATFLKKREERFSGEPLSQRIVNLQKSNLLKNKAIETADLERKIRLKTLDPEAVEGYTNPTVQGQAAIAYKELQGEKFGPNYADTKKDIKNRAEKLAGLNPNIEGRGSRQSFMAITAGENEFRYAYKKNIEAGMPQEAAEQKAREYVETVMSDTESKDSLFYKKTGPLNIPIFPNLEAKYNTLATLALETRQELRKGLIKKGIAVLDTPGAVGTEEELVSSTNDYYNNNGKFKYNSNELLVSKLFKVPPYAVRNAAITAFNKANGTTHRLIEPTALEEEVFDQDPQTLKLITDTDKITNNRFRRTVHSTNGIGNGPVRATMMQTGQNSDIIITSANDASGEPGSDFVISNGERGAKFYFPYSARVVAVESNSNGETNLESNPGGQRSYGNYVDLEVTLPNGRTSDVRLAHFDDVANLQVGQTLPANSFIGTQGRTGSTTGAHVSADWYRPGTSQPDTASRDWFLNNYLRN